MLQQIALYSGDTSVTLGNGTTTPITHIGYAHLSSEFNALRLKNLLRVPQLEKNLILMKKLCEDNNVSVEFFPNTFCVKDLDSKIIILMGWIVQVKVSYMVGLIIHIFL